MSLTLAWYEGTHFQRLVKRTASSSGEKRIISCSSSSGFDPGFGAALALRSKRSVRDVMMGGKVHGNCNCEIGKADMCGKRSAVEIKIPHSSYFSPFSLC